MEKIEEKQKKIKDWSKKSAEKSVKSMKAKTGEKDPFKACKKRLTREEDIDDPSALCASILDKAKGSTDWRKGSDDDKKEKDKDDKKDKDKDKDKKNESFNRSLDEIFNSI